MNTIEKQISLFYEKLSSGRLNYFDLLQIKKTATFKTIEAAFTEYINIFSKENIDLIKDEDIKKKAVFMEEKGKRAFKILGDYKKKLEYEKNGFSEEAPKKIGEDDPISKAKILYGKAKILYNSKRYDLTIITLTEAIRFDPDKASLYLLLGQSQSKIPEKIHEAEKNLLKAAELESWNAEPLASLGMLFLSARLKSKAESYFKKALALEPRHILAKKKLEEIIGPEISSADKIKGHLAKILPSLFKKK